jgi:hypothetical protein
MDIFHGPSVFQKDKAVYDIFLKRTVPHSKGFFILAPSGVGKTYFVTHQKEYHWIDGDRLWVAARAHPDVAWWTMGLEVIEEVDARSDVITQEAKRLGLWIMGASNNWLLPDAVVLPPWELNVAYIKQREETHYDGGLKSNQLDQLKSHRTSIEQMAKQKNVPMFESIDAATSYLQERYLQQIKN